MNSKEKFSRELVNFLFNNMEKHNILSTAEVIGILENVKLSMANSAWDEDNKYLIKGK